MSGVVQICLQAIEIVELQNSDVGILSAHQPFVPRPMRDPSAHARAFNGGDFANRDTKGVAQRFARRCVDMRMWPEEDQVNDHRFFPRSGGPGGMITGSVGRGGVVGSGASLGRGSREGPGGGGGLCGSLVP